MAFDSPVRRILITWIACSAAYFVVSLGIARLAHGADLDQLTSRSALSQAAAVLDRFLGAPYHWMGRHIGSDVARMSGMTPFLLLLNMLAWGGLLAAVWITLSKGQRGR